MFRTRKPWYEVSIWQMPLEALLEYFGEYSSACGMWCMPDKRNLSSVGRVNLIGMRSRQYFHLNRLRKSYSAAFGSRATKPRFTVVAGQWQLRMNEEMSYSYRAASGILLPEPRPLMRYAR
jgi:hypothetical protein